MKTFKARLLLFFISYYVLAFIAVAILSLFKPDPIGIINEFLFVNKIYTLLATYCNLIPTLQVTGILISFSWYFFDLINDAKKTEDYLFTYFKSIIIAIMILLSITTMVQEIASPLINMKLKSHKNLSTDFVDYLALAKKTLNEENYIWTNVYAQKAFQISPSSQEAFSLSRLAELKINELPEYKSPANIEIEETSNYELESINSLLQKAESFLADKKFFEAHYYASLVNDIEKQSSKINPEAQRIANDAWTMLTNMNTSFSDTSEEVFRKKKIGYTALKNEQFLKSYYIFKDLQKTVPLDPDVRYFLSLAKEEIEKSYFFIDETYNLQTVETARNIFFSTKNPDDSFDVIRILGIAQIEEAGKLVLYLRGVSIISYDKNNQLIQSLESPHAKMIIANTKDLQKDSLSFLLPTQAIPKNQFVPYIILNAIDRENPHITLKPTYTFQSPSKKPSTVHVCSITFDDFLLLTEATRGPKEMLVTSMIAFLPKAQQYGFVYDIYYQALCNRGIRPFVYFLLSILAATIAWKFRLKNKTYIKFYWLFFLPIFTIIIYYIIEFTLYIMNTLIYILIMYNSPIAIFVLSGIVLFLILVASLFFVKASKF
ncbi:MAG: hypothetical protein ACRC4W_08545 [Treponemataceae bacterium]